MKAICPYCENEFETTLGVLNAAKKGGYKVYCCRQHSVLARRDRRTKEEKVKAKSEYDKQYRAKNFDQIKAKKQAYNKTPKGREAQKRRRNTRMPKHIEYCRQPEYKAKKVEYDKNYRAEKYFGEFAECSILINQINKVLVERADKAELRTIQGTNTKSQRRKRQWLRLLQNLRQLT